MLKKFGKAILVLAYNVFLLLFVIVYTPIHLIRLCFSTKYRNSTLARLGFQKIPDLSSYGNTYWIHSVSVGETQVAGTLVQELLKRQPDAKVVISTITETGQAVAKKIPGVTDTFYYPLDFSWLANSMLKKIRPSAVFVVETDLWFNLLNGAKKKKIPAFLVNGKISETTLKRYKQFPKLSKMLLTPFYHFFIQSEAYFERFAEAGLDKSKMTIAGNVKLDSEAPIVDYSAKKELYKSLLLDPKKPIVTVGSTHAGEEELSVKVFKSLSNDFPELQFLLVPRHPERFDGVAEMLKEKSVKFLRASQKNDSSKPNKFVLVDKMGVLMKLYAISDIAVVAGSFTPHIGGHNIFEPSFYGKPFVYGPWIYKQPGFHQMNLEFNAGVQCKPEELTSELRKLLNDKSLRDEYGQRGLKALEVSKGATDKIITEVLSEIS